MPTVYRWKGYRFFFFSNEGSPPEQPHIHVRHGERRAKFWLAPEVALAGAWRMTAPELNELERIVQDKRDDFERAWHDHLKR